MIASNRRVRQQLGSLIAFAEYELKQDAEKR